MSQSLADELVFSPPSLGTVLYLPGLPGGGSTIYDRSPYGYNGAITGATWARTSAGLWYLDFDGTDDFANHGTNVRFITTNGPVSIECWFNSDLFTGYLMLVARGESGVDLIGDFQLRINNATRVSYQFYTGAAWDSVVNTDVTYLTGVWYHVCGTYDGATMRLYTNGAASSVTTSTTSSHEDSVNTNRLQLGVYGTTLVNDYDGRLALVRIYRRALTATEIMSHYQQERHLFN